MFPGFVQLTDAETLLELGIDTTHIQTGGLGLAGVEATVKVRFKDFSDSPTEFQAEI